MLFETGFPPRDALSKGVSTFLTYSLPHFANAVKRGVYLLLTIGPAPLQTARQGTDQSVELAGMKRTAIAIKRLAGA